MATPQSELKAPGDPSAKSPTHVDSHLRFVTAASLFDGHDASINIMRRILQAKGAEVIHLGHNRSVEEVVRTAIAEDAHGIALSSYQGGHLEYFKYMLDQLRSLGRPEIKIFGGGGGVIVPEEIQQLLDYGITYIYSPTDGQKMGLVGMIEDMLARCEPNHGVHLPVNLDSLNPPMTQNSSYADLARLISAIENGVLPEALYADLDRRAKEMHLPPVLGITGTGGAGKSSLTDEVIQRLRLDQDDRLRIAILAIDPTRRKTGGALLGDRIRMNAIDHPNIFMRSLATRDASTELPDYLQQVIALTRIAGFDLVIVETPGIGQGDAGIVPFVDASMYVMTPEFGAASQLEKIDMLDFADLVAINKFDRRGSDDALRDVRKQVQRNREAFSDHFENMPVYGTIASRFNDDGVSALYHGMLEVLRERKLVDWPQGQLPNPGIRQSSKAAALLPDNRQRYLAEIAGTVRAYHEAGEIQVRRAREHQQLRESARLLADNGADGSGAAALAEQRLAAMDPAARTLLEQWPALREAYRGDEFVVKIRDKEIRSNLKIETLSGNKISRVAVPNYVDEGEILKFLLKENLPGSFPYTAGVFPFKRQGEDPSRMFAGEGDPVRTNKRFKLLSANSKAKRLSTAFDSVTLYGFDPALRPDIYGKVGTSGVSIATLDDMQALYDGFDLCDPATSVSMTINGPAPTILAMFLNTAIEQRLKVFREQHGRDPDANEDQALRAWVLENVRGTVQADILKEDQGQNTCLFSTEFSLKVMGDIAEYFIANKVRNFYSVSISGYHIAEAGANPITQLALTLANGFTYVEAYLARGMQVDDFAPNLSFFFSNGLDPEYSVLGRVARRIWATTLRDRYAANARSQKLKYHIQTSGRSLHAQEMDFNDIRTTLQALIATYDHCNSLHTNAFDEAVTTPSAESVRRALAIQMVINQEWGLAKNENPNQGSFIIEELTDLVEEAVLVEFERISERGGVLGAMETGYQRGKIQDESMHYEHMKHDGSLPIIGVNTFLANEPTEEATTVELSRASEKEKQSQLQRLEDFQQRNSQSAPEMLARLRDAVIRQENVFAVLVDAVRVCSLGQITDTFFQVGGKYRRNM